MQSSDHKRLLTSLSNLEAERRSVVRELTTHQKTLSTIDHRLGEVRKQIEALKQQKQLTVSEHAMLRYLERVKGITPETLRLEILGVDFKGSLTNGSYPVGTHRILVRDGVVTTVMPIKGK